MAVMNQMAAWRSFSVGPGARDAVAKVLTSTQTSACRWAQRASQLDARRHRDPRRSGTAAQRILTFLAAREAAHHRLFQPRPWLASQLLNAVETYARGMKIDMSGMDQLAQGLTPSQLADPQRLERLLGQGMFEPKATPEQTAALERLEALLAIIEGWVQTVVTAALGERIPARSRSAKCCRRRRATGGPIEQTFATLVGRNCVPCKCAKRQTCGSASPKPSAPDARDAVWQHPDLMPTAADLDEPAAFIDRIIGGDTSGVDIESAMEFEIASSQTNPGLPARRACGQLSSLVKPRCNSCTRARMLSLDPGLPVLLRPDSAVQVGWGSRRARIGGRPTGSPHQAWPTYSNGMHARPFLWASCIAGWQGLADRDGFDHLTALVDSGVARSHVRVNHCGRCQSRTRMRTDRRRARADAAMFRGSAHHPATRTRAQAQTSIWVILSG